MIHWRKIGRRFLACSMVLVLLSGCGKGSTNTKKQEDTGKKSSYKYEQELAMVDDNTRNYYEIFVYSFYDSNGDGIGDLNGVTKKLDYIQDMGFNGIWLMPIMPSPTYHKYDTTDYCNIDEQYGTLDDFKKLLEECHKRDIHVIIDFMMNHTSTQHSWFQSATKYLEGLKKNEKPSKKACPYYAYYNFVPKNQVKEQTYYQVGSTDWYYEGQFWEGMPDLNLKNKTVQKELEKAAKFWLDLGVDGFRLDGVKYFTNGEESNIKILKWFNDYVKSQKKDAYIVSEVWDNYNVAAEYLKSGIDSTFDFSFGQSTGVIVSMVRQSQSKDVGQSFANAMLNIQDMTKEANPKATVAEFLTNHDTGRMANILVSEEKIKMAYALELFMSGNAFVYYGEEIALTGAGKDENFRSPMYWSATDQTGITDGPEDMDEIENRFPSVEEQQADENSILNFIKRCLRLRNENPEIARGEMALIPEVKDEAICAITKEYKGSKLVMLYNMSTEEKKVTVSKDTYKYQGIRGYASTDGSEVALSDDTVTLPPYSVVILK
ncbi:MAG: alpha amylase [Lachnospiraceae bacterium]|nr:alpha amylase [Lachnospiraceae bacterium]